MINDTTNPEVNQAPTDEYLQPLLDSMQGPFSPEWMEAHDKLRRHAFSAACELVRVRQEGTPSALSTAHEDADRRWSADIAELRRELQAERDFIATLIADLDARSGEPL